jgi:hypothetical protein
MAVSFPINTVQESTKAVQVDLDMQYSARKLLSQLAGFSVNPQTGAQELIGSYSFPYYIAKDEGYVVDFNGKSQTLNFRAPSDYYAGVIRDTFENELSAILGIKFYEVDNRAESLFDVAMFDDEEKRKITMERLMFWVCVLFMATKTVLSGDC